MRLAIISIFIPFLWAAMPAAAQQEVIDPSAAAELGLGADYTRYEPTPLFDPDARWQDELDKLKLPILPYRPDTSGIAMPPAFEPEAQDGDEPQRFGGMRSLAPSDKPDFEPWGGRMRMTRSFFDSFERDASEEFLRMMGEEELADARPMREEGAAPQDGESGQIDPSDGYLDDSTPSTPHVAEARPAEPESTVRSPDGFLDDAPPGGQDEAPVPATSEPAGSSSAPATSESLRNQPPEEAGFTPGTAVR